MLRPLARHRPPTRLSQPATLTGSNLLGQFHKF